MLRRLDSEGYAVRTLLPPSRRSPDLPLGVSMEVALSSILDERGVRAALRGAEVVVHLAGDEGFGGRGQVTGSLVEGTRILIEAALESGLERLVFLSQLGADRSSAYPLMRAAGEAEEFIRRSGIPYTIIRPSVVYGPKDHFTTSIAMQFAMSPVVFPMPGDGSTLLQPLWIEDLAICIAWMLDEGATRNSILEIGGPEFLSYEQILRLVLEASGMTRILVPARQPYLRAFIWMLENLLRRSPINTLWIDYLAANRTAELNSLPAIIGLQPSRMEDHLGYLQGKNWGWELLVRQFGGGNGSMGS